MKLHFIKDGNISGPYRVAFGLIGGLMIILPAEFMKASWLWAIFLLCGFVLCAIGGATSRAAVLRLKPFDSNSYEKIRKTYETKDEGEEQKQQGPDSK